jgi:hypothetical protein
MADQPERAKRQDVVVFTADATGITNETMTQLKEKYGLEIRVRSSLAAVDGLLARSVDVVAYDRTYPGYGRVYDRDPNTGRFSFVTRVNPAERLQELEAPEDFG